MGRAQGVVSPASGKEWTLRLPWPNSGTSSRTEVHRFITFIQQTLNIHSRARECVRCQDLKQRAGQVQSALPSQSSVGGWPGPGWSMAWGLSVHSLCLECWGEVGRIVAPRWNGGWPCLVGVVRHEMPSWVGAHHKLRCSLLPRVNPERMAQLAKRYHCAGLLVFSRGCFF